MDLSYEDVEKILKIIDGSSLEELHLELGDLKLVVRKRAARGDAAESGPPAAAGRGAPPDAGEVATAREAAGPQGTPAAPPSEIRVPRTAGVEVKAPMVGTFYRAPVPGAPPFVEVGSVVTEDDAVGIIEVMKLMSSIRAGCRGRVVEICAENSAMVEFGQTLMVIEPLP